MNTIRFTLERYNAVLRWMARASSILFSSEFLIIVFLALTNEDKPRGMAVPVLALLALTIAGCFAAWRWERVGGLVVVLCAIGLGIAAYLASLAFGLGPSLLPALIYSAPFLLVGILFLACGQAAAIGRQDGREASAHE